MSDNSVANQERVAHEKQVNNLVSSSSQASPLDQAQRGSISSSQALTSDNDQQPGPSSAAGASTSGVGSTVPRRPQPIVHRTNNAQLIRRGQFVAFSSQQQPQHHGGSIVIEPQTSYGVPITAQIELANALQPAGRATAMPPKRPSYLPSRPDQHHHAHHRFPAQQLTTSLGATALTSNSSGKPNRYSWAQMQQWHAAQSAAQMGATGDLFGPQRKHGSIERGSVVQTETRGGFHYHFSSPFSSAASRVLLVPNPIMNLGEHTKSRLIKIIEALKRFSEKWFSHVLLLLFLASYACLGAYVFISFESPTEQWEKRLIIETRLLIVNESYDQARELASREQYVELFRTKFEEYERLLNRMCASGMTSSSLENQWTFWGALFYSMTVFTTIGYGHLTPITFAGRVATMIYAIFGIPILLMVLADLGKLLTRIIKYAFKKFRYWYNKLLGRKATVRTRQLISDHSNQYIGVAKNAFERGFATYIQPYQSRTASAFRDAQLRMANLRRGHRAGVVQVDEAGNTILLVNENGLPVQQQAVPSTTQMESSEVIVTPPKQTKPVSPKVTEGAGKLHPLAELGGLSEAKASDQNESSQQNHQPHHSTAKSSGGLEKHAQSHFNQSKRKISATGKLQRKNSVSRSSSTSNVAGAGERQSKAASIKRASLDQMANQPTGVQSKVGSDSNLQSTGNSVTEDQQQQQIQDNSQTDSQQKEIESEEIVDEYDEMDEDLDIPVTFALFLLITYMMFGAVVFSIWESWNFFDALYFVFISMSTIGFGDLVPQHPKRMIGTFAYLLFGLALTSMCINVVQEKIHATFLRAKMQIGEKMGFDLDHIMADDYYDSGSAYGDEPDHMGNGMDDDNGSYAHSVAVSQSNSQISPDQQHLTAHTNPAQQQSGDLRPSASIDHHQAPHIADQQQHSYATSTGGKSKSKESLKWKKRSSGGSTDQHSANSIKRKISSSNKKLTRQPNAPSSSAGPPQSGNQTNTGPSTGPIKSQIETIRMFNLPVESQFDDTKPSRPPAAPAPYINQPITEGIKSFCQPLRRVFQSNPMSRTNSANKQQPLPDASAAKSGQELPPNAEDSNSRASLAASKSLDSSPLSSNTRSRVAILNGSCQQPTTAAAIRASGTMMRNNSSPYQRHLHQSERYRGPKPLSRSLNSSRRASVSHELSQLDDLIVSLSGSPPERFGPLLGVPAQMSGSRSGRSASPNCMSAKALTSSGSSNHIHGPQSQASGLAPTIGNTSHRRGTSMMVRASTPSGDSRTNLANVHKKRSLVQSPSHQLILNQLAGSNNELQAFYDQRRKSSSSYASTTSRAPINDQELNLSESQAALDELEAIKYSAL